MQNKTLIIAFVAAAFFLTIIISSAFLWNGDIEPRIPIAHKPIDKPKPEIKLKNRYLDQEPSRRPKPADQKTHALKAIGKVRISNDAHLKKESFWLEQEIKIPSDAKGMLADLYLSIDPKTTSGVRVRVTRTEMRLEQFSLKSSPANTSKKNSSKTEANVLARHALTPTSLQAPAANEKSIMGALWRGGELSVWWNHQLLITYQGDLDLSGASGATINHGLVDLGSRRVIHKGHTSFRDSFMRSKSGYAWLPLSGKWELTALSFPGHSANPFSIRASFGTKSAQEDRLYKGRLRRPRFGLGIEVSAREGTFRILRITGGSPAARAGLQEDDTVVALNGMRVDQIRSGLAYQLLHTNRSGGAPLTIQVLRPGSKSLRTFTVTKEMFRWGTPLEGVLIKPVNLDRHALIVAGEEGWSDYAAEVAVKPIGGGAIGLAVAVTSVKDYLLLRWVGEKTRAQLFLAPGTANAVQEGLELVRVQGGKEHILLRKELRYRPYEFYRLSLDWQGERIIAKVDGAEIFRTQVKGLRRGKVGLYARSGDPVFFDDVTVDVDRGALSSAYRPTQKVNNVFTQELDMERWANPALEWERDGKSEWALHTGHFPGEQVLILKNPRFDQLEVRLLTSMTPQQDPKGVSLILDKKHVTLRDQSSALSTTQALDLTNVTQIIFRAGANGAEARINGVVIKLPEKAKRSDGSISHQSSRIAIRGLKNLGTPDTARVTSSNTLEYTFDQAPTDWKISSGRWGLLNKWICDPRWSWFGGRTQTLAAIWNKYQFSGDLCIDAHVALMMQRETAPYERPGDYNLVLFGDGTNLNSGYSLVCGGGENFWTRLYRNGKQVAESTDPSGYFPSDRVKRLDKPLLHQRWFHLRLEKSGNQITFYLDKHKVLSFKDPDPIQQGRVGFWTVDNGVLLSRCKISSSSIRQGLPESRRSALFEDETYINMYQGEVHTQVQLVPIPKSIHNALQAHPAAFQATTTPADSLVGSHKSAKAWKVMNGISGGPLALQHKIIKANPATTEGIVRFAIQIQPGTKVDFYLKDPYNGDLFRWRLTGPTQDAGPVPLVAEIPGVKADGKWHAIQFNLTKSWLAFWHKRHGFNAAPTKSLRPMIASLDNQHYTMAGFNGNPVGASYAVTEFKFFKPQDADLDPPLVKKISWPYDKDGDGRSVQISFKDPGGSGIDPKSLQVTLNGKLLSSYLMTFDQATQTAKWDLLKWHSNMALTDGTQFSLAMNFASDLAGNRIEKPFSSSWTFSLAAAKVANKPLSSPRIKILFSETPNSSYNPTDRPPDFSSLTARSVQTVSNVYNVAFLDTKDAPSWATTKRSVQIRTLKDGSRFGFRLQDRSYYLAHWPYLAIDYKIPFETPVNIYFASNNSSKNMILLTDLGEKDDSFNPWYRMGGRRSGTIIPAPKGFKADGTWRHLEFNFLNLFAAQSPKLPTWHISNLIFQDKGWRGNRKGMRYSIHSIKALPAARSTGIAFNWYTDDLCGITTFASMVDTQPDTIPDRMTMQKNGSVERAYKRIQGTNLLEPKSSRLMTDGWYYFHLRTKNRAGAWSPTTHLKFRVDNTPPQVSKTEPPHQGKLAGKTFKIYLSETHAVHPSTIRLSVNGHILMLADAGVSYDPKQNVIMIDASQMAQLVNWRNGTQVRVALLSASDVLGNGIAFPYRFTFTIDRRMDVSGPRISKIRFAASGGGRGQGPSRPMLTELSMTLDMEETLGHVRALQDCKVHWSNDPQQAAFGKRAARFTVLENDANVEIMLHKNAWHVDRLPLLMFDYKAIGRVPLNVHMLIMGKWHVITFLGGKGMGSVSHSVSDGTWRHASVNLRNVIDRALLDLPVRIISQLKLSAGGQPGCQRGSEIWLDNVHLSPEAGQGGQLEWEAGKDPSGIEGYGVVVDQQAKTEAPNVVTDVSPNRREGSRTGTWYAHIRAVDQAGNWGPTKHFRMDF